MTRFLIFLLLSVVSYSSQQKGSLKLVQVFFRHGARTPEEHDSYPNDPYKLEDFLPMGWGQLTNLGKEQAYTLGKVLRNRYDDFLGDIFYPEIVFTQSTDYERTKMSAQLVLAGLFPPPPSQVWDEELKWLPIPVYYEKAHEDFFLRRARHFCPVYEKAEKEAMLSEQSVQVYLKNNKETFEYLTEHAGRKISNTLAAMGLFQTLTAEKTLNLTLPEWTNSVYPEKITELAVKQCMLENSNIILKKLNGGRSIQQAIENMIAKSTNEMEPPGRKIFLYSGHENNVLNILTALDMFDPHFPNYSSATVIELHYLKDRDEYAVKILYLRELVKDFEEKQVNGCDIMCPLTQFIEITRPIIPGNYTAECESRTLLD